MKSLENCTLTYEKLWDDDVKEKILAKLATWSSNIFLDENFECEDGMIPGINLEQYLNNIKSSKMDDYKKGIRQEFDLGFRGFSRTNWVEFNENESGMTDEEGDAFTAYCYNGERQDQRDQHKVFRYKGEWCSGYCVGHLVEKFILKIMVYDKLLFGVTSEDLTLIGIHLRCPV